MIEYENIISKFKNRSYFNELFFKYNFWKKKNEKKNTFLNFAGSISLLAIPLSLILFFVFQKSFGIYLLVVGIINIFLIIATDANNLINRNEIKQIENLNEDFVKNLKENQSILQDLAKLAVDEPSTYLFLKLTDIALSNVKDSEPLKNLLRLLRHYSDTLDTFSYQEERNKALKNLNIVLDMEKELPKETEDFKNKQKLLEML